MQSNIPLRQSRNIFLKLTQTNAEQTRLREDISPTDLATAIPDLQAVLAADAGAGARPGSPGVAVPCTKEGAGERGKEGGGERGREGGGSGQRGHDGLPSAKLWGPSRSIAPNRAWPLRT